MFENEDWAMQALGPGIKIEGGIDEIQGGIVLWNAI
jgi:hypothetical protein